MKRTNETFDEYLERIRREEVVVIISDEYIKISEKYFQPAGETMANQAVSAIAALTSGCLENGDCFDNTYTFSPQLNDISYPANWLYKYTGDKAACLADISKITYNDPYQKYEKLLKQLVDNFTDEEYLETLSKMGKVDSIYTCEGPFHYIRISEETSHDDAIDDLYDEFSIRPCFEPFSCVRFSFEASDESEYDKFIDMVEQMKRAGRLQYTSVEKRKTESGKIYFFFTREQV